MFPHNKNESFLCLKKTKKKKQLSAHVRFSFRFFLVLFFISLLISVLGTLKPEFDWCLESRSAQSHFTPSLKQETFPFFFWHMGTHCQGEKERKKNKIYINILYVYTYIILHYFLGIILIFCGSIQMYKLMCYHNPDRNTFIIKIHWLFCRVSNLLCLHLFFMAFSRSCNI